MPVITESKSKIAALEEAKNKLHTEKILYTIEENSGGLFKNTTYKVKAISYQELLEEIKNYLQTILEKLDIDVSFEILEGEDAQSYEIVMSSSNNSLLIGKDGKNLKAFEQMVRAYISKDWPSTLKVILNGLGKDAAKIISRVNGFTYVETKFDYENNKLEIVNEKRYSDSVRGDVKCYGAYDVREGVAIMMHENVDISITGDSTNPTRFQHPVAGIYKKHRIENGLPYFSVASGGGTGRTLHPDNMAAGPASYGLTDTMGRMHSDAQFAGSSSVPAHVEMMGFIGMGNNPIVGATVKLSVKVIEALNA